MNKLEVWLNPGEMLYLPAGWFHEVSSFGSDNNKDNIGGAHIAIIGLSHQTQQILMIVMKILIGKKIGRKPNKQCSWSKMVWLIYR